MQLAPTLGPVHLRRRTARHMDAHNARMPCTPRHAAQQAQQHQQYQQQARHDYASLPPPVLLHPLQQQGSGGSGGAAAVPKLSRAVKTKSNGAGRTYTSKFRGVHQTFPTKRWEAQFRRNGKPTSLGGLLTMLCLQCFAPSLGPFELRACGGARCLPVRRHAGLPARACVSAQCATGALHVCVRGRARARGLSVSEQLVRHARACNTHVRALPQGALTARRRLRARTTR